MINKYILNSQNRIEGYRSFLINAREDIEKKFIREILRSEQSYLKKLFDQQKIEQDRVCETNFWKLNF